MGTDCDGPFRRVLMSDGEERVQRPHVTIEATHTHAADGRAEDVSHLITDVKIGGAPCA